MVTRGDAGAARAASPGRRRSRSLESLYYALATPLIRVFWAFLQRMPEGCLLGVGRFIGRVILFGRKRRVIRNMRMVLERPGWGAHDWEELWRRHVDHLGLAVAETLHHTASAPEDLRERLAIEGDGLLRAMLRRGKGAVVFVNHLANPVAVPLALALAGHRVSVATNVIPVPYLDERSNELFERFGGTRVTVGGDVAQAAEETLRGNGVFVGAIDYSSTQSHTAWVRFGKAELQVSLAPALMALMHGSAMFSAIVIPEGLSRYMVSLQPVVLLDAGGGPIERALANTRDAMRGVSEAVCRRPEQWWRWDFPRIRPLTDPT